jgi:hypothetical protein
MPSTLVVALSGDPGAIPGHDVAGPAHPGRRTATAVALSKMVDGVAMAGVGMQPIQLHRDALNLGDREGAWGLELSGKRPHSVTLPLGAE